jgi:hypothetical protein
VARPEPSSASATRPRWQITTQHQWRGPLPHLLGMYGMYALQETVRQMDVTASAQMPGAKISVCHGVGGLFAASGTSIMINQGS